MLVVWTFGGSTHATTAKSAISAKVLKAVTPAADQHSTKYALKSASMGVMEVSVEVLWRKKWLLIHCIISYIQGANTRNIIYPHCDAGAKHFMLLAT